MPYNSPHADSIARLMLSQGDAAAEAQRRSGEIWGNAVANIGQQVGRTLADLGAQRAQAPQREAEEIRLRGLRRQDEVQQHEADDRTVIQAALTAGNGDPDKALSVLDNSGNLTAAKALREHVTAERTKVLDAIDTHVKAHTTLFGQGTQLLQDIQANPKLYPQLRPKLLDIASQVDPSLVEKVPEAYDANAVKGMMDFTLNAAETAAKLAKSTAKAKEAFQITDDAVKRDKLYSESILNGLAATNSQEEMDAVINSARVLGIPQAKVDSLVGSVGGKWSPALKAAANDALLTPEQRAKANEGATPGSPEAIFRATATELFPGRPIASLSGKQQATIKKTIGERTQQDSGSMIAVTETDPDTGEQTIKLVPRVLGTIVKTTNPDDPGLPRGVKDYIATLPRKPGADGKTPLTFEQAQADMASQWAALKKDHPRLDPVKADAALRDLFRPAPGSGQQSMADLVSAISGGKPAAPAAKPVATPAAPAAAPVASPKPSAAPAVQKFDMSDLPGGKVRVKAPDGTVATFANKAAAEQAIDAFNKQK